MGIKPRGLGEAQKQVFRELGMTEEEIAKKDSEPSYFPNSDALIALEMVAALTEALIPRADQLFVADIRELLNRRVEKLADGTEEGEMDASIIMDFLNWDFWKRLKELPSVESDE